MQNFHGGDSGSTEVNDIRILNDAFSTPELLEKSGILDKSYELTPEKASAIVKNNCFASIDTLRTLREGYYDGQNSPTQYGVTDSCHLSIICMFNHSCINNCRFFGIGSVMFVLACRDIPKGEEILDCYYPQNMPMNERQVTFRSLGFTCKCPLCM